MTPAPGTAARPAGAAGSCYNMVYSFTCVPPPGFTMTSEAAGPGKVLTLVKRSQTAQEEGNLVFRVYPLGRRSLQRFVKDKIAAPASKLAAVRGLQTEPARLGEREGYEVRYEREFASGAFRTRFFCFERGMNVFITEHTVPASRAGKGPDPLEGFVGSLNFR